MITAVAAAVLLGEAWGKLDALGSLLCMLGVMLISKPGFVMTAFGFPAEPIPMNGLIGAVLAAVMSSAVYLLVRVLKGRADVSRFSRCQQMSAAVKSTFGGVHPIVFVNYFAAAGIILGPISSYLAGD